MSIRITVPGSDDGEELLDVLGEYPYVPGSDDGEELLDFLSEYQYYCTWA